jgi:hypothetical protein
VTNVENARYSTRLLAATTLRNILGTRSLQGLKYYIANVKSQTLLRKFNLNLEILQDKNNIQYSVYVRNIEYLKISFKFINAFYS